MNVFSHGVCVGDGYGAVGMGFSDAAPACCARCCARATTVVECHGGCTPLKLNYVQFLFLICYRYLIVFL